MVKAAAHMMSSKEQVENFMRGTKPAEVQHVEVLKKLAAAGDYTINYGGAPELRDIQRARRMGEMPAVGIAPTIANPTRQYEPEPDVTSSTDMGMDPKSKFYNRLRSAVNARKAEKANRMRSIAPILDRLQTKNYGPAWSQFKRQLELAGIGADTVAKLKAKQEFAGRFNPLDKAKNDSNLLDPSKVNAMAPLVRQENWSKYQAARNADIDAREQAQAAEGVVRKRDERINPLLARAKNDSNLLDPSKVKNEGGPTMAFRVRQILDKLKGNRGAQAGIGAGVGGLAGAGISAALGGGRGANTLAALLGAGALGTAGYMYGDKAHQYLSDAAKKYIGA